MLNKKLSPLIIITLMLCAFLSATAYANQINVSVEGELVNFPNQEPVIVDGHTFVPVRGVFELLGFEVSWDDATKTAKLTDSNYTVNITIGSPTFVTNNYTFLLDVPAQIINGSTMLPIRAVLESVGYGVGWESETSTVIISSAPFENIAGDTEHAGTAFNPEPDKEDITPEPAISPVLSPSPASSAAPRATQASPALPTGDTTVYVSDRSRTIHSVHNCGGMKNYREMTLFEAWSITDKYCDTCADKLINAN